MKRKILTIDGGGLKGAFPASFLATIEDCFERPLWECFDLIVGTSTGGIIAMALGLGIPASEVKELYFKLGPGVFSPAHRRFLGRLWAPKYDPEPLREFLQETFADSVLGASKTRLVVPALHAPTNNVYVYKTKHHERFELDHTVPMVDVAMATAAAPTYFRPHITGDGQRLVDGGIWANNPLGMAAVEAIGVLGWPRDSIVALSLGCTSAPPDPDCPGFARPKKLASYVTDLFADGQSHASMGTASLLIGHNNIIRVDPIVPRDRHGMDSTRHLDELQARADKEARDTLPRLREMGFDQPAEPFEPYS